MYTYCNNKHAGKLIMPCQGTVNHMGGTPKQIHNCPLGWLQTGVATSTNRSLALQWLFSGASLAPAGRAGTLDPWYHMSRMPQAETYRLYPGARTFLPCFFLPVQQPLRPPVRLPACGSHRMSLRRLHPTLIAFHLTMESLSPHPGGSHLTCTGQRVPAYWEHWLMPWSGG